MEKLVTSHDYEAGVILKLLVDQSAAAQCDLSPDEFDNANFREIYRAIEAVYRAGEIPEIFLVRDQLLKMTGRDWLTNLIDITKHAISPREIGLYIKIIRNENEKRKAREIGQYLTENHAEDGAIDSAIRDLMALSTVGQRHQYGINAAIKIALAEIDEAFQGKRKGISTGIADLDEKLGGLHNGDLIVIGARPAMGKTAFALNMALAASNAGIGVGIFSGEQDINQITQRLIAIQGRVPVMRMRNGGFIEDDFTRISAASQSLKDRNFITDDTPSPSFSHVMRTARQWRYANNIGVLYIDYLQRMAVDGRQKRFEAVGENVRGLKNLARELNIPVVVLAQVSRDVEKRTDKRPGMGDLSDSSEIEKEADQVFLLYRDEVYNSDTPDKGIVEILIDKNRHGPTGFVRAVWRGECLRFENLVRHVA